MSEILSLVMEIMGTIAFSVSGALVGAEKEMDLLGITSLGVVTAVGGGVIRDVVLGLTPPLTFRDPTYVAVAIVSSWIVFIPQIRNLFEKNHLVRSFVLKIMDAIGLGIFTVMGVKAAFSVSVEHNMYLMVFVGLITGIGGGIIRDVLAGEKPAVFTEDFYGTASIIGSIICTASWVKVGATQAMLTGTLTVIVLRLLAIQFDWGLPKVHSSVSNEKE